jgi:hypothetical protein
MRMANGWIVTVRTPAVTGSVSALEVWYAAIPDRTAAEQAIKDKTGASADTKVLAHQEISDSLMIALKLKAGDVKVFK